MAYRNMFQIEFQQEFDDHIGRLDRILSEFLLWPEQSALDLANRQTLKHHADDLIGVGQAMLKKLKVVPELDLSTAKNKPCEVTKE